LIHILHKANFRTAFACLLIFWKTNDY